MVAVVATAAVVSAAWLAIVGGCGRRAARRQKPGRPEEETPANGKLGKAS